MATTTFSGPIKAGTISNTTGTTVGADMKNTGQVVMSQTVAVDQTAATDTTNIIIPANSQIVAMDLYVNTVWSTGTTTMGIGKVGTATAFTAATAVQGSTLGLIKISPTASAAVVNRWTDIGTSDNRIIVTNGATGTGAGYLCVQYVQNNNLI
jgi:hypothetical protein|tara:strand:- start:33 stop:491 length:459 start_codon:yes stop_codon:yes gene_type:complete